MLGESLLDKFKVHQANDAHFFCTFQLDKDGGLLNVFWRDGMPKMHFESFADVMIFDTTHGTN